MSSTSYPKPGPTGPQGPAGPTGATGATGAGFTARTLLSTTSLSGLSSVSISAPSGYADLLLELTGVYAPTDGDKIKLQYNGDTSASYYGAGLENVVTSPGINQIEVTGTYGLASTLVKSAFQKAYISILDYSSTNIFRVTNTKGISMGANATAIRPTQASYYYQSSTPITTLNLSLSSGGNFSGGSAKLYGIL